MRNIQLICCTRFIEKVAILQDHVSALEEQNRSKPYTLYTIETRTTRVSPNLVTMISSAVGSCFFSWASRGAQGRNLPGG